MTIKRQWYYEDLCAMGMPEVLAASMAEQAHNDIMPAGDSLRDEVYAFSAWVNTKEGLEFWSSVAACL